jgi:ABC-type branched-subunit amino acid transport system substrate-binding protein
MYVLRIPRTHPSSFIAALILFTLSLTVSHLCLGGEALDYLGESSDKVFDQAVQYYEAGECQPALERFEYLLKTFPTDKHYTGFLMMTSRCQVKLGRYEAAERGLSELLESFPQSSYRGAAYIMLGDIAFVKGEPLESVRNYLRGYESAGTDQHRERARRSFLPLLERHLTLPELEQLSQQYRGELLGEVFFHKGRRESEAGQSRRAINSLERFLVLSPGDQKRSEALKILDKARETASTRVALGVLAPLSGAFADYGESMVRGIKLAVAEKSNPEVGQIELTVKDTKGEPVSAALAMGELAGDEEVVAIIGPLRSESAVGATVSADCHRLPIITPTASEAGISGLSDFAYQLSPSSETMARELASYASGSLKIKQFATLAPNDSHGPRVSEVFAEEMKRGGGELLRSFYYAPGQTDFKGPLGEIRDTLLAKTKTMWENEELDSALFFDDKGDTLPPEKWPVYLDGLFVLGYADDMNLIAPQVAFSIIKTRLLGLEGFSDIEALKPSKDYVQGAVFCCHFIEDEENARWVFFSKKYREKFGETPDWVAALSYDCAKVILKACQSGALVPEKVNDYLKRSSKSEGVTGDIRFEKTTGENQGVGIYRIEGSALKRLK